ncbi:MAG: hypothetical protein KC423_02965 [Anaerolineales bacterium]|nr:hypothetical protein [Anaerolineales bacterium]
MPTLPPHGHRRDYLIEGYVPTADVERLLAKKPDICGMAVPDMPAGSPGMEMEGVAPHPFNVIAFDAIGNVEVFANCKQRDPKRVS